MAHAKVATSLVETKAPIERMMTPFHEFLRRETTGGILLFACTIIALVWANSPYAASYFSTWQTKMTVAAGSLVISKPLLLWINDGLMAVFFFVVGLEIKREMIVGELTSLRKAALPVMAAVGGMLVPALLYSLFNFRHEGSRGWGIPMATDIAFSLSALQLLGHRVPLSLKVFLTAFAIVDDIGAVLVIAFFYTASISFAALGLAAGLLAAAILFNVLGVRRPFMYALLGVVIWIAILKSGVHATVAGVLLAMVIPARTRIAEQQFLGDGRKMLDDFERAGPLDVELGLNVDRHAVINTLQELAEGVQTPLQRLEDGLHPWVTFLILPLFALANAGVALVGTGPASLTHPVALGIVTGLVAGKVFGISLFSWLAVQLNMAALPTGVTWRHVIGVAFLGGIGFTMSLFVANLAFGESQLLTISKIGILVASLTSGVLGFLVLIIGSNPNRAGQEGGGRSQPPNNTHVT
jgi:Na+:H+ antiporter, NhaA family